MGMPKKGSRTVDAGGCRYRYAVKETNVPDHRDQKELQVTVQRDEARPGNVMQFRAPYGFQVSPEVVRRAVETAVRRGWDPGARGAAFHVDVL